MPQTHAATTLFRDTIEDLLEDWTVMASDRYVCAAEMARMTARLEAAVAKSAYVDDTVMAGLSWLKNGLDSQIVQRRLSDHRRLYGDGTQPPVALTVRRTTTHPGRSHDPSAA